MFRLLIDKSLLAVWLHAYDFCTDLPKLTKFECRLYFLLKISYLRLEIDLMSSFLYLSAVYISLILFMFSEWYL